MEKSSNYSRKWPVMMLKTLLLWANKPSSNWRNWSYLNTQYPLHLRRAHARKKKERSQELPGTSASPTSPKPYYSSIKGGVVLREEGLSVLCIPMQSYSNMNVHLLFTVCIMREGILNHEFNIDISNLRLRQNSNIYTLASKLEAKGWISTQGLTLGFRGR